MPDLKSIGAKIALARKSAGLSQKALAEKIGTAQGLIAEFELGNRSMTVVRLLEISKALGIDAAKLME